MNLFFYKNDVYLLLKIQATQKYKKLRAKISPQTH